MPYLCCWLSRLILTTSRFALALLARRGVRVNVLTATRGRAGSCGDPPPVSSRRIARRARVRVALCLRRIGHRAAHPAGLSRWLFERSRPPHHHFPDSRQRGQAAAPSDVDFWPRWSLWTPCPHCHRSVRCPSVPSGERRDRAIYPLPCPSRLLPLWACPTFAPCQTKPSRSV